MEEQVEFERNFELRQQERVPRRRIPRRFQERNPLFLAVIENDLDALKSLIESGRSVNSRNRKGCTLLIHIIEHQRVEMFDYILSFEELLIDQRDCFGKSALLYAVSKVPCDEYFPLKLIAKGANIHLTYNEGYSQHTILHMAAWNQRSDNLILGELVIEKGVDINTPSPSDGVTPLWMACDEGNYPWVYMLLYYGALATIPSDEGVLPFAMLSPSSSEEDYAHLSETLFNLTFMEGDKITVKLSTLIEAMAQGCLLFPKLLEITSHVDYDRSDLMMFEQYLVVGMLRTEPFKLFVHKFDNILRKVIQNTSSLLKMLIEKECSNLEELKLNAEFILTILESNCVTEFVQKCDVYYPKIGRLLKKLHRIPHMSVEEVTKIVILMLSHGLTVTAHDLDIVYDLYGYCELFKILLHMEIKMVHGRRKGIIIAEMYYDPSTDIEVFFHNQTWFSLNCGLDLLSFYNHPRLKEMCLSDRDVDEQIAAKAQSLPPVPSLKELSRNMTRKFIVDRYKIKNSMQFYTILRWLPINEIYKKIIALEKELY